MRVPKTKALRDWEKLISKYMVSVGVPLRWDERSKRFQGVKGFSFTRIAPASDGGWSRIPQFLRRYESELSNGSPHPVVMFVTNTRYGPDIEDSLVVTRVETFTEMLRICVENDPNRYLGEQ